MKAIKVLIITFIATFGLILTGCEKTDLIRKILQLAGANVPGEAR